MRIFLLKKRFTRAYIASEPPLSKEELALSKLESFDTIDVERCLTEVNLSPPGKYLATLNLAPLVSVNCDFCGDSYL